VERHDPVVGAHVVALVAQGADTGVAEAVVGRDDLDNGERERLRARPPTVLSSWRLPGGRPLCRKLTWELSMPPSSACSQFDSWMTLDIDRWVAGTWVQAKSGGAGFFSGGPM
jgi:hypothetical protein